MDGITLRIFGGLFLFFTNFTYYYYHLLWWLYITFRVFDTNFSVNSRTETGRVKYLPTTFSLWRTPVTGKCCARGFLACNKITGGVNVNLRSFIQVESADVRPLRNRISFDANLIYGRIIFVWNGNGFFSGNRTELTETFRRSYEAQKEEQHKIKKDDELLLGNFLPLSPTSFDSQLSCLLHSGESSPRSEFIYK